MNAKVNLFLKPFFIGVGALVFTFMLMMMSPPVITSIVAPLLYFFLGVWVGRMQPQSLWYAPLLMNILIWVIFIPMGMELWPPIIHIWYFLIPPLVALPAAYFGMYVGSRSVSANSTAQNVPKLSSERNLFSYLKLRNFGSHVLLFVVGFAGMFLCHFFVLLIIGLNLATGVHLPFYLFTYPIIYPFLVALWSLRFHKSWFSNACVVCLAPSLYWFLLLRSDGELHWSEMSFNNSTSMMAIMPLTILLCCLVAFFTVRFKKSHSV